MSALHSLLLALGMGFTGFTLLAMTMERHHSDFIAQALPAHTQRALQAGGYGVLVLALLTCMAHWPTALAVCVWLGALALAATLLGLLFTYRPQQARYFAPAGALACACVWMLKPWFS